MTTEEIKVLDRGYVKLIGHMGTDEGVIEAARMSTGRGFEGWEKDAGLLEFLYSNKHMTPFEMGELCIEVKAPLFVFREWHRHRTQSYNEFSGRYAVMPDEHYLPAPERIQKQATANKQGSAEPLPPEEARQIVHELKHEQADVYSRYERLVTSGVAKEVARVNTPVSRYSKMRAKANVRNWLGFLHLRMEKSAQWEIQQYAVAVSTIIQSIWPRTYDLFLEHDFFAVRFSRTEMRALRELLVSERPALNDSLSAFVAEAAGKVGLSKKKTEALFAKLTEDKEAQYPHLTAR